MPLRERLASRSRPTATYLLQIDDTTEAERELSEAQAALILATDDDKEAARERVKAAQSKLEDCFEPIVFTALPPKEFEALVDAHPPRKGTEDEAWDTTTFPRACFLACAPGELSSEEWDQFIAERCSDGETSALYSAAISANIRVPDPSLPKGLMEILA